MAPLDWSKLQRFHRFGGGTIITWGIFMMFGFIFGAAAPMAFHREVLRCVEGDYCSEGPVVIFLGGFVLIGLTILAPIVWALMVPSFVKVMKHRAHEVVWLYPKSLRRGGYVVTSLVVGLANGKTEELDIARGAPAYEPFVQDLLMRMAVLVPQATIGFSGVNEARFAQNPRSLLRA